MSLDRAPLSAPVPGPVVSGRDTYVFTEILGSADAAEFHTELHRLDHAHAVDHIRLPRADLARRRLRVRSDAGRDIAVALPREQKLFDGAVLELDAHSALVVRVEAEEWLRLRPADAAVALRLGYFCGNLHWRVRFDGTDVLVALESAEQTYLDRLAPMIAVGEVELPDDVGRQCCPPPGEKGAVA